MKLYSFAAILLTFAANLQQPVHPAAQTTTTTMTILADGGKPVPDPLPIPWPSILFQA